MTTEITKYDEPATTVETHKSVASNSIRQTANELADAHQIATAICRTAFVPEHFRGKPEETAVGILYGATVGFDPLTAVQQIFVIGGKPALYARAMVAIVLKAGHQIWTEEEKPGLVTVCGQRAGSDKVSRVTWTSELAKQAGYDKNPKYRSDPRSMLYARASGDIARRIAPDALLGLAYNVEEMQLVDYEQVSKTPTRATPQDEVRAALGAGTDSSGSDDKTTQGEALPPNEPSVGAPSEPEVDTEGISRAQSRKMHASFNDLGITERPDRLAYSAKVVGRELKTSNEMTKAEGHAVIEALIVDLETTTDAPADTVDAEIVVMPDALWEQIVAAADKQGMSRWDTEEDFSQVNDGIAHGAAAVNDLRAYLNQLTTGEVTV